MMSLLNPGMPPLSHQDILDNAGRQVDRYMQEDRSYLDLADLLCIPSDSNFANIYELCLNHN